MWRAARTDAPGMRGEGKKNAADDAKFAGFKVCGGTNSGMRGCGWIGCERSVDGVNPEGLGLDGGELQ